MNAIEREARDFEIMKLARAGVDTLTIAKRHRLTHTRVNQIVEREQCRGIRKRRSTVAQSRARAVKVKRS